MGQQSTNRDHHPKNENDQHRGVRPDLVAASTGRLARAISSNQVHFAILQWPPLAPGVSISELGSGERILQGRWCNDSP